MAVSFSQYVDQLADSGLLARGDVETLINGLPPDNRPRDGQALARLLVSHEKLTAFQAQQVYSGKARALVLGNYVVLDKLGQGGMGMVLKAEHKRMERAVALKVLSPDVTRTPEALARFQREVRAAAKLSHPNIVIAYDADADERRHFLVMELVDGNDLAELVADNGPLSVELAANCILQAARGLEYAHGQGVVHRDIKPANLLLDREGTVKILDMGLARLDTSGDEQDQLTGTGQIMGTVDYIAPEQAMDTRNADARADIYSLGMTFWFLLTGRAAYEGPTVMARLLAHRESPIPSLLATCPDAPRVNEIFARMAAKQPEDRYQSMTEVIADLEECLAGLDSAPATTSESRGEKASDSELTNFLNSLPQSGSGTVDLGVSGQKSPQTDLDRTVQFQSDRADADSETQRTIPAAGDLAKHRSEARTARRRWSTFLRSRAGVVSAVGGAAVVVLVAIILISQAGGENGDEAADSQTDTAQTDSAPPPTTQADTTTDDTATDRADVTSPSKAGQGPESDRDAPPLLVAPFNTKTASPSQQAWADYLHLPVEMEIKLSDDVTTILVLIPPGEFMMGSTEDEQKELLKEVENNDVIEGIGFEVPQHRVRITRPFYLGRLEVTQAEWQSVMQSNPSAKKNSRRNPVETVSWHDVQIFLTKMNDEPSEKVRFCLPTEAQWEYACRAGTTGRWNRGDTEPEGQCYRLNEEATYAAGDLEPNAFGLYDMHGNVWEWCQDYFAADYYHALTAQGLATAKDSATAKEPAAAQDPSGPELGATRVIRGGCWDSWPVEMRSAYRGHAGADVRNNQMGFRLSAVIKND